MNNSYSARRNITSFSNTGKSQPISGIELMIDSENMYFAGNDDGYVMTIDCPYGTQQMANDLLAKAKGFEYQGYTAEQVVLPPEAELGDGINVAGIYGMIARRSFKFTPGMTSNIEAPRELEVQHEYKYTSPQQRKIERQIAETKSSITKTASEIELKIEGLDDQYTSLKVTLDGVTVSDASGTTKIKGSSIETSTLKVSSANITGTLTIGQLPDSVAETSDIPTNVSELTNDSGYQTRTGVVSIVNGTVTADYIYALGVEANSIRGSEIAIKNENGDTVGGITTVSTTSGYGLGITSINGGVRIDAPSKSNIFLNSGYSTGFTLSSKITMTGALKIGGSSTSAGTMFGTSLPSTGEFGQLYFLLS